jgi:hypothetical protein
MNRFLLWDHGTLARFAQDVLEENMNLRKQVVRCTCGVGAAVSSIPHATGEPAPTVSKENGSERSDKGG